MTSENRHLHIEHLSNSISKMSFQTEELNSQHADLRKVRLGLESKADSVRLYQVSDVNAKLLDSQVKVRKKLDEAIMKGEELQNTNGVFADKVKDHISNCKQEQKSLVQWVSDWGEEVTELSKLFLHNHKLYYSDNLIEDLKNKENETEELLQLIDHVQLSCDQVTKAKNDLESSICDCNLLDHFLNSFEATSILDSLKVIIEKQKNLKIKEAELLQLKGDLEKVVYGKP